MKIEDNKLISELFPFSDPHPKDNIRYSLSRKMYYKPFDLLTETDTELRQAISKISQSNEEHSNINKFLIFIKELLFKRIEPQEENEKYMLEDYYTFPFIKTKELSIDKNVIQLREQNSKSSSNFINFIYDLKLEGSGKKIPYFYGVSLKDLDKVIRKESLIDGKYSPEEYEKQVKSININNINNYCQKLKEPSKIPVTKFLAVFFPNLHSKDPNIVQLFSEKISIALTSGNDNKFEEVHEISGDAISYFYNGKNYHQKYNNERDSLGFFDFAPTINAGTLKNSCMKYDSCFPRINFFSNNYEKVSMVVIFDEYKKIRARAILWTTISGKKLMDRVYYSYNEDYITLQAYAKAKGYIDIYNDRGKVIIASLTKEECENYICNVNIDASSKYPYLDSMRNMDIQNNYMCALPDLIEKYLKLTKKNGILMNAPSGTNSDEAIRYRPSLGLIIKGERPKITKLKDIEGNNITNLSYYTYINFPKKGFYPKQRVKKVIGYKKPIPISHIKESNNKYNNFKEFAYFTKKGLIEYYMTDKKFLVWSHFLRSYILREQSYYNTKYNTFFFKDRKAKSILYDILKTRLYKKHYGFTLVKISEEGFKQLKEESEKYYLTNKKILQKVRPSRKFYLHPKNIYNGYVIIKNIPIKIQYLKKIK